MRRVLTNFRQLREGVVISFFGDPRGQFAKAFVSLWIDHRSFGSPFTTALLDAQIKHERGGKSLSVSLVTSCPAWTVR